MYTDWFHIVRQPGSKGRSRVCPNFYCSFYYFGVACCSCEAALLKLEEPKWLSGGSHTSVFNGGLLGIHFGSPREPGFSWLLLEPKWLPRRPPLNTEVWLPPESQKHLGPKLAPFMAPIWIQNASHEVLYWVFLIRKGSICINGSLGSPKSSFTFMCE